MAKPNKRNRPVVQPPRLGVYRPVLDRLLFAVALIGILITVHLVIQQGRGFDRGCLGFSAPGAAAASFDCNAVVQSDAGKLFGISNAFWGLGYYIVIAALGGAIATATGSMLLRLKQVRALLIVFGFLYSLYLISYQFLEIGEFCLLCSLSAATATVLFILQTVEYFKPHRRIAMPSRPVLRDAPLFAALAVIALVLVGADLIYFKNLEAAAPAQPALAAQNVSGEAVPVECTYDPTKAPITDYASLIDANDPMKGTAGAPVTVIEIFEPNCGHCKLFSPIMEEAAERYGDQAGFYFMPIVFWPEQSAAQVLALYDAAAQGKFFEMLDRQFALQNPQTGLSLDQLAEIAEDIGMDAEAMEDRIRAGLYNAQVNADMFALRQEHQVNSVPALLINGKYVASASRNVPCIGELIAQEAAAGQQ